MAKKKAVKKRTTKRKSVTKSKPNKKKTPAKKKKPVEFEFPEDIDKQFIRALEIANQLILSDVQVSIDFPSRFEYGQSCSSSDFHAVHISGAILARITDYQSTDHAFFVEQVAGSPFSHRADRWMPSNSLFLTITDGIKGIINKYQGEKEQLNSRIQELEQRCVRYREEAMEANSRAWAQRF